MYGEDAGFLLQSRRWQLLVLLYVTSAVAMATTTMTTISTSTIDSVFNWNRYQTHDFRRGNIEPLFPQSLHSFDLVVIVFNWMPIHSNAGENRE